jgi:ABC-type dipeptide/oligopeptide/nickel transport system permease subunit
MAVQVKQDADVIESPQRINELRRFLKVFLGRPVVVVGGVIIILLLITAAIPSILAPYDPTTQNLRVILAQPSSEHLLGTDSLGRDILSRIIYGARTAVIVGFLALGLSSILGMTLGLLAGYFGGVVYSIIMRFIDAMMAFPAMLLTLAIVALLGGGMHMVIIALGFGMMTGYARVMCAQTISLKENDYVLAAHSLGAGSLRIMVRHILPNAFPPMIVMMTIMIGSTILAEAGLSYLGIGIKEPTVAWGSMVNDGYKFLLTNPLLSLAPGLAIIVVVYAFNMVGDGLRDAIDPRLRGTL